MASGFGRTAQAHSNPESGIYTPQLPGMSAEKTTLADGIAQLARFESPVEQEITGLAFDVTDASTAANEVQQIAVDATGGTFVAKFGAAATADLAFDIAAADLQTALEGLAGIGKGNVTVTGGPGDAGATQPYVITFGGALADQDVAALTTDPAKLTGGAGTAAVTTSTPGDSVACDVGIYNDELNLLGSNGGEDVAATAGAKVLKLAAAVRLQAGRIYYAAFSSQGGAAKVLHLVSADTPAADLVGATAGKRDLVTAGSSYPLPAAVAVGASAGTKAPLMGLRTD